MSIPQRGVGTTGWQEMFRMRYRVDIDFIGLGNASAAYGGFLRAWSFREIDGRDWFKNFRDIALAAIGRRYLPIYRMADGEYRFLMGRRFNPARRPRIKEVAAIAAERLKLKNPDKWKTSWGEAYRPADTRRLRAELIDHIRTLSRHGYLACYINDNGLNAFTEYNAILSNFFASHNISFEHDNYVPFHFAPSLFVAEGWQDFICGRTILVVTGLDAEKERQISDTLTEMGARQVLFLPISSSSAMTDRLDLSRIKTPVDICLVAAGIGSANILRQLEPLGTLSADIGGLMNCFTDRRAIQHGGVIGLPDF